MALKFCYLFFLISISVLSGCALTKTDQNDLTTSSSIIVSIDEQVSEAQLLVAWEVIQPEIVWLDGPRKRTFALRFSRQFEPDSVLALVTSTRGVEAAQFDYKREVLSPMEGEF